MAFSAHVQAIAEQAASVDSRLPPGLIVDHGPTYNRDSPIAKKAIITLKQSLLIFSLFL